MPAPSPGTQPSRRRSNGRQAWRRVALPARHVVEQAHPDQAQRMDLGVGPAGDHHVGPAAGDDPRRLGDRQVGRGVGLGDRVARPLAVDQDRDVAGEHVGQILQQPDRLDHPDRFAAPDLVVERLAVLRRRGRSPAPARPARWRSGRPRGRCRSGSGSTPPSTSPASATASCAAATASWMSRAMYFRLLRERLAVLGQGVVLQVEVADLGRRRRWAGRRPGRLRVGRTAPRPRPATPRRGPDYRPRGVTRPRPVMTTRRSEPSMKDSSISPGRSQSSSRPRCSPDRTASLLLLRRASAAAQTRRNAQIFRDRPGHPCPIRLRRLRCHTGSADGSAIRLGPS